MSGANGAKEYFSLTSEFLHYVTFISGLILLLLSLKSEVLISQTYESAKSTIQASFHQFETFRSHLEWIIESISPEKFGSKSDLLITISTPVYGIGVSDEEANLFLDYFESWVKEYEQIKTIPSEKPTIELAVWDKHNNINTFNKIY